MKSRDRPSFWTVRVLVVPSVSLMLVAGCSTGSSSHRAYRIYLDPDGQEQTIAFEMDALPGEVFKIVIPEKISAKHGNILEWNHKVSSWEIGPDQATWSCKVPEVVRQRSTILFGRGVIEARVEITNLSDRRWERIQAFTCFAFYAAPRFDNPSLDRIYFPVDGGWRSVKALFAETDPGPKPYTFFPVRGGPELTEMEIVRRVQQQHPQIIDFGAGSVVSRDGEWVAGMYCREPAYVFCNRRERCIHANPLFPDLAPGERAQASSFIRIMRGRVNDFERVVRGAID